MRLITRRSPKTIITAIAAAALALPAALLSTPGPVQAATPSPLGVYIGSASVGVNPHKNMENWLGAPLPYALDFASAAQGWPGIDNPTWIFNAWKPTGYRLVLSTQMFPKDVEASIGGAAALNQCASGAYDSHWAALGRNLVAKGLGNTIIRPGWEFNNNWFGWGAYGRTTAYKSCFQHMVTKIRSASGQSFQFTWNPSIGAGQFPAEQAYPGDAYVDQVGVDLYDWSWASDTYQLKAGQTAAQRLAAEQKVWDKYLVGDHGLQFWASFAAQHHKKMAIPEWALAERFHDSYGGGDDPYFITQMFRFIYNSANNVQYATYFNSLSPDGDHRVYGSQAFPSATSTFRSLAKNPPVTTATAADCTPSATPAASPATSYPLLTSATGSYSGSAKLDLSTVKAGALRGWIAANKNIKHVQYFLDNTSASGTPLRDEWSAPYDIGGSTSSGSLPVNVSSWSSGPHKVTAKVFLKSGGATLVNATVMAPLPASCPG